MKTFYTIILLFLAIFLNAQDNCSQECFKTVTNYPLNYSNANIVYTGCIDRFDIPNGNGKKYIIERRKKKKLYEEGCFENGKLNGFGKIYYDGGNYVEGDFTNGKQLNGIFLNTNIYGLILYEEYVNGKVIKKWNNTQSSYNEDDIISSSSSLVLDLIKHPNYLNAYYVDAEIGSEIEVLLFVDISVTNFLQNSIFALSIAILLFSDLLKLLS